MVDEHQTAEVAFHVRLGMVDTQGNQIHAPMGWAFLKAGDAAVSRRVRTMGPSWRVMIQKGRRKQALGLWAPQQIIAQAQREVEAMRAAPNYEKRKASALRSREKKQSAYEQEFLDAVVAFLNFAPRFAQEAAEISKRICQHATPVGSGTVARTQSLPVSERAAKAVIAWMRHQTTGYDHMHVARIKGERRRVRRQLADQAQVLLTRYRSGEDPLPNCPLLAALLKP